MFVSYAQNENNTSHRVQAKQMKRPALVPSTPNSKYITRLETGLKGKRYTYIYTEYSPPSPLTYLPLITSALQVLRHIRQMHSQESSAPVWRAPANAGACAADALCAIFSPFLFRSKASPKNGDTPGGLPRRNSAESWVPNQWYCMSVQSLKLGKSKVPDTALVGFRYRMTARAHV